MSGSEDVTKLSQENEELRAQVDSLKKTQSQGRRLKIRGIVTGVLIVLTTLSIVATTVGVWVNRTIWNTDRYVALVAPLADNLAVTNGLAIRLTEDTFQALDIPTRVQQALASIDGLPEGADALLAGPLTSAAKNLVQEQVEKFLASDAFDTLWTQLNERVHTKLVALLDGDLDQLPNLAINDGQVQLNMVSALSAVLQNVAQQGVDALGLNVTVPDIPPDLASSDAIQRLSSALGVSLPADFGQITIMSEAQLNDYQAAAGNLKKLSGALFVLSCILLVVTIVVSPRRRRTLIWLGVAIAIGFFLGGVLIRRLEAQLLDVITNPSGDAAAKEIFTDVLAGLRRWGLLVLIVAVLVAVIAYLAGRPPWVQRAMEKGRAATASRPEGSELDVWLAGHADLVRIGGALVGAVILFVTGIDWIPVGIVVAL
ncbi:MAG TPA: hypothetical protein VI341_05885, partial [Actinomycetota bacterium]